MKTQHGLPLQTCFVTLYKRELYEWNYRLYGMCDKYTIGDDHFTAGQNLLLILKDEYHLE